MRGLEQFDSFGLNAYLFERDAHLLVLATLGAAEQMLSAQVDKEIAEIKVAVEKYGGSQRLDDNYVDALSTYTDQMRFLRNNALVALTSMLYTALREMADAAQWFAPGQGTDFYRNGSFGKKGEYPLILNEYEARFKVNFKEKDELVTFIGPMIEARNRIVHHGGKPYVEKEGGIVEETSAASFTEYVQGNGISAEIEVTDELLESDVKASVKLVRFLAEKLRVLELAFSSAQNK